MDLTLTGHEGNVYGVAVSPDGTRIASGGSESPRQGIPGELILWDAQTGEQTHALRMPNFGVCCMAFSPDGMRLATGSHDGTVRVWDLGLGQEALRFKGDGDAVYSLTYRPDGKHLAAGGSDGSRRVWDAATGRLMHSRLGPRSWFPIGSPNRVETVAYSPDGNRLVSGCVNGTVRVWDIEARADRVILKPRKEYDGVDCVAFSPDRRHLAVGIWDGTLRVLDARTGEERHSLRGHGHHVKCLAYSPDGQRIASGGEDGRLRVWDTATGEELLKIGKPGRIDALAYSPDGRRIIAGGWDGPQGAAVWVWDVGATRPPPAVPHGIAATAAQLAADVLRGAIPPGVLADYLEDHACDVTGFQAQHLRWGNLYPAGYWAGCRTAQG